VETRGGEFVIPDGHLSACHVCDRRGRNCGKEEDGGEGVEDVDFILYVSAEDTKQCGEAVGE